MTIPEVSLERRSAELGGTWGILSYPPANLTLHTVERLWVDNKRGISCVPCGRYLVRATYSPRFGRKMYLLLDVPHRDGIRIHPANWPRQLNGCIALGTAVARKVDCKMLLNSRVAVSRLERTLGLQPFYLTITGEPT
jgi:hypothetical protein